MDINFISTLMEKAHTFGLEEFEYHGLKMKFKSSKKEESKVEAKQIDPNAPVIASDPVNHKIEQLSSLLKLDDAQLVDQLFPEVTDTKEETHEL